MQGETRLLEGWPQDVPHEALQLVAGAVSDADVGVEVEPVFMSFSADKGAGPTRDAVTQTLGALVEHALGIQLARRSYGSGLLNGAA